jgi:hypothetical protein
MNIPPRALILRMSPPWGFALRFGEHSNITNTSSKWADIQKLSMIPWNII